MVDRLGCAGPRGDVIEFGCGYGTFTIPTAKATNDRVYAIDINPAMVKETTSKAAAARLSNVIGVVRDFVSEGTGLPDAQAGRALLFNILHIENPLGLLREAYRILRPGGELSMIHWRKDIETPRGPSLEIRPTAEQCRDWAEQVGFEFVRQEPLSCCSYHWGLLMRRPAN
jgi:SAM-dependent methyltransferase